MKIHCNIHGEVEAEPNENTDPICPRCVEQYFYNEEPRIAEEMGKVLKGGGGLTGADSICAEEDERILKVMKERAVNGDEFLRPVPGVVYMTEPEYVGAILPREKPEEEEYGWVTNEMFDAELNLQVSKMSADDLLAITGVYEVLSEALNNQVLEALREKRDK